MHVVAMGIARGWLLTVRADGGDLRADGDDCMRMVVIVWGWVVTVCMVARGMALHRTNKMVSGGQRTGVQHYRNGKSIGDQRW
jgi:hypothetical protein